MAKFIKLRLTRDSQLSDAREVHVRMDAITIVRAAVENYDWFKTNYSENEIAPAAVVYVPNAGNFHTVETPEQILALIAEAKP